MTKPQDHNEELIRVGYLKSYGIDSQGTSDYERILAVVAKLVDVPCAIMTIVDEHHTWIKAAHSITTDILAANEITLCNKCVHGDESLLVIEDLEKSDCPHKSHAGEGVPVIKFYAGMALQNKEGYKIGTIALMDYQPRQFTAEQQHYLKMVTSLTMERLEFKKLNSELERTKAELQNKNGILVDFARIVTHDIKTPLANIILNIDVFVSKIKDKLEDTYLSNLSNIKDSAFSLSTYVQDILTNYESSRLELQKHDTFVMSQVIDEIYHMVDTNGNLHIDYGSTEKVITSNKSAIKQILNNLITNAIKYNDKDQIEIEIRLTEDELNYFVSVSDNGMGIPASEIKGIFDLFKTLKQVDRFGQMGRGMGLSTVKNLINKLGGIIEVVSEVGVGTKFNFNILKPLS